MASVSFPPKTIKLISGLGLSEKDVMDVFHHGEQKKEGMIIKKYAGYEIGLYYVTDKNTGEFIITYVWKRERR